MLTRLSQWLSSLSTGRLTLAALVIFILFGIFVLPAQAEKARENAAGTPTPDLSFWYSAGDLYQIADTLGADARQEYIRARWTFDLVFPFVYTFTLVTAISWLFARGFPADSPWQKANLVPLAAMLFDFLENSAATLVMWRYPALTPVVAELAGVFTAIKWLLVSASMILILAGIVAALRARVTHSR